MRVIAIVTATATKGAMHVCASRICGGQYPLDKFRYVFVGADKWKRWGCANTCNNISPVGMRFLKLKLTDTTP